MQRWRLESRDEEVMRLQILAFIEEHYRNLTLRDVCEWYAETFAPEAFDEPR
jgi:hypothetical protein